MKIGQHRRHASHVVGVSVGYRHDVELVKLPRPQVGRHHILSDIQFRVHPERYPAGIDQEGAALRRHQKDRIALAHVNGGDFEHAGSKLRDAAERRKSRKR